MSRQTVVSSNIEVLTDRVKVRDLVITGQPAQRIVEGTLEGNPPDQTINKMLEIGSIALSALSVDVITHRLDEVTENFASIVSKEASETFPKMIEEKTKSYIESITKYLDPKHVDSLRTQLDQGLSKIKGDIAQKIDEEAKSNKAVLEEALKNLGFLRKTIESSPQKGLPHQEYVGQVLERFAGSDLVSDLSTQNNGKSYVQGKSQSGDYRVTLGETLNSASPLSFVVEAKNAKMSERDALEEIKHNKENRGVEVGILVFATAEQAPTQGKSLKFFPGNRIIVVCDQGHETALYAAYAYARNLTKSLSSDEQMDHEQFFKAIEEILHHLDIETSINKEAKIIRNGLERLVKTAIGAKNQVVEVLQQFDRR